jgi:hypothetical protein
VAVRDGRKRLHLELIKITTFAKINHAVFINLTKSVHRSVAVKQFVADNAKRLRLRLIRLPGYCPELHQDELLNQDVKTNAPGKSRPTTKPKMIGTVRRRLHHRRKEPHVIRDLFKEQHVRYAAGGTGHYLMHSSVTDNNISALLRQNRQSGRADRR